MDFPDEFLLDEIEAVAPNLVDIADKLTSQPSHRQEAAQMLPNGRYPCGHNCKNKMT